MSVADNILDAVEILVEDKVSSLQFNKTIRGKISEVIDASIGKYKIQYQNSYFTAYTADSNATYVKGSEVYVEILSNDFEKNAVILGTVRRLGSNYLSIVEELDKYSEVGANLQVTDETIGLCSYGGSQVIPISLSLDSLAQKEAAAASDSLKVAMKVKTALDAIQRAGGGNYGLKIAARYTDAAYIDKTTAPIIEREYVFDINSMVGQPYKFTSTIDQYVIFPIDAANFIDIVSISAFCENFPVEQENMPTDIFLSDINLQFLKSLTEEELASTSLKITTPKGNYFSVNNTGNKILHAELKVKGKKVNYDSQPIDFYWFKRNLAVDANDSRFSSYGGNGWECLNKMGGGAFLPSTHEYNLSIDLCESKETKFKCVAVFLDSGQSVALSDTITFKNLTKEILLSISSLAGTQFSFNVGATTLTLNGYTPTANTKYCWTESIDGGAAAYFNGNKFITENHIDINIITPAARLLTYECSVYENDSLQGTASISLFNSYEALGYTLVINDGQQIFKYDTYGVSPAGQSKAAADRMTIPVLSFDIYDRQGNIIDIANSDKTKYMTMRWIWPTDVDYEWDTSVVKKHTMLSTNENMEMVLLKDLANNRTISKYALVNKPTFTYGIIDRYNVSYANTEDSRNQIRLEVEYQGEFLTATTNFTFTKEGELGTNGTKYTARIEPIGYEEIFIYKDGSNGDKLYGIVKTTNGFTISPIGTNVNLNSIFAAQLWDGSSNVANNADIVWSLSTSTERNSAKPRLTISKNNSIINLGINSAGTSYSNILQATITYDGLDFYATYPMIYTTGVSSNRYLWIIDGYREVMYESDGTRSRFNSLPFRPKWLTMAGYSDINEATAANWSSSWDTAAKKVTETTDQFTIEPPSYFIGETVGHYIKLTYNGLTTYLPIELYLNRYGMSAMNGWDGSGLQINEDGGYILAPQVGAGRKETDNSFTGITIGEVFQDVNNKEIGMFGYYKGQRSLFLDAETGDAEFGVSGLGQIKIHASDGEGTIDSGDYSTTNKTGLKIKFTSTGTGTEVGPYIRYGSGNFTVDANGNLVAKGGGTVAGWKITDDSLGSQDNKTILYSQNGPNMKLDSSDSTIAYGNVNWDTDRKTRFNIADRFKINEDGAIISTAGLIGGWKIGTDKLFAKGDTLVLNKEGSIWGPPANYEFSPNQRIWEITKGGIAYFTDVKIKNVNAAEHGIDTSGDDNNFLWYGKVVEGGKTTYPKIFELTDTGSNIGGWNITGNELNSGQVHINSANAGTGNAVLSVGQAFAIYGNGNINATGGSIGGCSIGGGGISSGSGWALNNNGTITISGHVLHVEEKSPVTGISCRLKSEGTTSITITIPSVTASGTATVGGESGSCSVTVPSQSVTIDIPKYEVTGGYSKTTNDYLLGGYRNLISDQEFPN